MTELNVSQLSNTSVNFDEMSIEKIDEYIGILEEFMSKSEKEGKFVEAELAKQRIIQLNKVKDKKNLEEAKYRHMQEKEELETIQKEELNQFNIERDKKFYELTNEFQEKQNQLEKEHEEQIKKFEEEFDEKYSKFIPKPTNELAAANKKLELYVKQKDYQKAHLAQIEVSNIENRDKELFEIEKAKKYEKEIENLKNKQNIETKALEQRIQASYNKFKKDRAIKVEALLLKYKNRFRELENKQKNEIKLLEKIVKEGDKAVKGKNFINYNKTLSKKPTNKSFASKKV